MLEYKKGRVVSPSWRLWSRIWNRQPPFARQRPQGHLQSFSTRPNCWISAPKFTSDLKQTEKVGLQEDIPDF